MANIDGQIDDREVEAITDHFVADWGLERAYVEQALIVFRANIEKTSLKELASQLAKFQNENPDCNAAAMTADLAGFLRDIAMADGRLDEREELAIEAVAATMAQQSPGVIAQIQGGGSRAVSATTSAFGGLAQRIASIDGTGISQFARSARSFVKGAKR